MPPLVKAIIYTQKFYHDPPRRRHTGSVREIFIPEHKICVNCGFSGGDFNIFEEENARLENDLSLSKEGISKATNVEEIELDGNLVARLVEIMELKKDLKAKEDQVQSEIKKLL